LRHQYDVLLQSKLKLNMKGFMKILNLAKYNEIEANIYKLYKELQMLRHQMHIQINKEEL
jgi:hypothetical protein